MENVLLATELVKDYHKDSISSRCAMKIDISKAFDYVQWGFLLNTLEALNFPEKFRHWIKLCITTATFSVQVNGELAGFFNNSRGLRQGCALSPYLFVICMNVLSHMIDKAAVTRNIGYHPKCKNIGLTHLCFADDLMVFVDGQRRSIEGIIHIFQEFAGRSGLKISLEKSMIYLAGVSDQNRDTITANFPFATGHLPVRYLGLPLLTKRMTAADYAPLLENIRGKISSWTARALSYAGRLTLINSVIVSISNFWISAYRLPSGCIKEIEKLCAAFLWSGPDLNPKKAKIAWTGICRPKQEGGLGIKSLVEANKVSCLKLIWRIVSKRPSWWVTWTWQYLIRTGSFWSIKANSNAGSWMWRKILKYRDTEKKMHRVEVKNGHSTSYRYDNWSPLGRLIDVMGCRGAIDMGIPIAATVGQVLQSQRTRQHRVDYLNNIEAEIRVLFQRNRTAGEQDLPLWQASKDKFSKIFTTKHTCNNIRHSHPRVEWHKGVWFTYSTPKFSFLLWLAIHNRLSTGDRIKQWNSGQQVDCVLCSNTEESRDHLFFTCSYTAEVWKNLTQRLPNVAYSTDWDQLVASLNSVTTPQLNLFLFRYVFQATLYHVWRERNARRHGEVPAPTTRLIKLIDKNVRNRISAIKDLGDHRYDASLSLWFSSRPAS